MSTLSPSSADTKSPPPTHSHRAPPPSLFLGPPSDNTSNLSLPPGGTTAINRAPLLRARSIRGTDPAAGTPALARPRTQPEPPPQTEVDRTDALWAEMQATLAEVELSALSSTHVFGNAHHAALEELREAQIALAKAWGRGEADEEDEEEGKGGFEGGTNGKGKREAKDEGEGGDDAADEADIAEARRRREANEKFFKKVGEGVVDVVGKLEGVSKAMEKVERESREIWRGSDSVESGSVS